MRRLLLLAALPLCFAGARQTAPIMSCQTITSRMTLAELEQRAGDLDAPERSLDQKWADAQRTRMSALWTTDRKSAWRSANGIKVGMAIADVDLLNERSFLMKSFDTDDPGLVLSWAGGKLTSAKGDESCRLVVRMAPSVLEFTRLEWRLIEAIQGTPEVSSDDRRIKPYKVVVSAIGLEWR